MAPHPRRYLGCIAAIVLLCSACTSGSSPRSSITSAQGATSSTPGGPQASTPPTAAASWTCPEPSNTALPTWARTGFSDPTSPTPHLTSDRHTIVAVPFGWPLRAPQQTTGRANKILWIAKAGDGRMRIVATERTSGRRVTVELPDGPGPSYVNMPVPGCWRFALSWADQRDTITVRYYGGSG